MNRELLAKFLAGQCSDQESKRVIAWSKSDSFKQDLADLIVASWNQEYAEHGLDQNAEHLFETIMAKAHATEAQTIVPRPSKSNKWYRYAAAVVITAVSVLGWYYYSKESEDTPTSMTVELQTLAGQKKTLLLSDGSKVILNSNTTIRFNQNFTDTSRVIELTGEGYFVVAKDTARPFSVVANEIWTTALGTEFNVSTRDKVEVALNEGKVSVYRYQSGYTPKHKWLLNPGEKITYYSVGDYYLTEKFLRVKETGWTEGILFFENESFEEVLNQLTDWYDVNFIMANGSTISKSYSGSFRNESLENVLKGMSFSLGFDYEIRDKQVTISSRPQM